MKILIILALSLFLINCNESLSLDVTPNIQPVEIVSTQVIFFIGTADGVERWFDVDRFDCISGYTYSEGDTSLVIIGADLIDITCIIDTHTVLYTGNPPSKLYGL